jgi:hypothetical protein
MPLRFPSLMYDLSRPQVWTALLVVCALIETALQTYWPSIFGFFPHTISIAIASMGVTPLVVVTAFAAGHRQWHFTLINPAILPWLSGGACVIVGWLAGTSWPNSGDEHSYVFLADTILAGRWQNPAAPDAELFQMYRIFTIGGHTFSQYPPGWPLVLAPFRLIGVDWLANPLLTVLLGVSLLGAMRCLRVGQALQPPMLLLVMFSPFVLFNGASLFSNTLSATLTMTITWQQLTDEERPTIWRKALIGALFGMQLLTRYEAFLLLILVFAGDRLWRRGGTALRDAVPMLLGALPLVAVFLWHNWTITGSLLQTPAALTNPDMTFSEALADPRRVAVGAAFHVFYWTGSLGRFGGMVLLVLQLAALVAKTRSRSLRFFDLVLPLTIIFFLYFPNPGGHQYGPRYWYSAWPLAALTVVSGLLGPDNTFRLLGRRFSFDLIVAASLVFDAAMLPGLVATTRTYIDARREVFADVPLAAPAVVLIPSRHLSLWPLQREPLEADSLDFARGDINFNGPVLYLRLEAPDSIARACRLPGRAVFVWREPGDVVSVDCADAAARLTPAP